MSRRNSSSPGLVRQGTGLMNFKGSSSETRNQQMHPIKISSLHQSPSDRDVSAYVMGRKSSLLHVLETIGEDPALTHPHASNMIETGFGIRNLDSFQNALAESEKQKKLREIYDHQNSPHPQINYSALNTLISCDEVSGEKSDANSQTISSTSATSSSRDSLAGKKKLQYLMGLPPAEEEYSPKEPAEDDESLEEPLTGSSENMRNAQRYLRVHKIFQFFQFLITHLLSAAPKDPVEFLIDLLDTCLMYRSGLCEPPLLYDRRHLEVLFYLLDRMRTGFIDIEQYKTGMNTLGICSFNQMPPTTRDGMITKDYFIDEAYESLINLLNDLLRQRYIRAPPPVTTPPPPSLRGSYYGECGYIPALYPPQCDQRY